MSNPRKVAGKAAHAEHRKTGKIARKRNAAAVKAVGDATEVADQPPLIAISLATIAAGALLRQPTVLRAGSRMLASHLIATGLKTAVKASVDRTRPAVALAKGHTIRKGRGAGDPALNSFPSGHTAGAVAVAEAVTAEVPAAAAPARMLAGLVGAAQLPRGRHYLSDVVAGAAIGWLSERIADAAMKLAERAGEQAKARRDVAETEAHPS